MMLFGMPLLSLDESVLVPMFVVAIPIVAIVGGITAGIVHTISRHRMMELAQRERIAAIERGLDPAKLPSLTAIATDTEDGVLWTPAERTARRRQGLLIGGLVTLFAS